MPAYKYLIFDVDDTLLDFHRAFMTAQRNIAEKIGIIFPRQSDLLSQQKSFLNI